MKFITRKLYLDKICFLAFLFLLSNTSAFAQERAKESKKITIITKKIDKDGIELVEKMELDGNDLSDAEIDEIIEKAKKGAKEIEVSIEQEEEKMLKKSKKRSKKKMAKEEKILIMEDDHGELHEEHLMNDEDGEMEVTVSVDEDGNTKIIKKRRKGQHKEDFDAKLKKMGITLPDLGEPVANYVHAVTSNNWVFLAGKGPRKADGKNIVGKLGKDLSVEQGYEAAKWAGINLLAALKGEIGDLNRVVRIVKVNGMVNAIPEFTDHSKVINGFSDLMVEVFGDKGRHARAAVGMSSLPGNMAVEIEIVVEIE